MLKDRSAKELADALDAMAHHPHNTGGLSLLDGATLAFGWKYPAVRPLQEAFVNARRRHKRSYAADVGAYSDEAWSAAMRAAQELSAVLRQLGSVTIPRCKRKAGWGVCNLALDDDDQCSSSLGHVDGT